VPTGVGLLMAHFLSVWRWPVVSFVAGFLPVLSMISPALSQDSAAAWRPASPLTVSQRLDDGPKFFTIRQIVDRQAGKASTMVPENPAWPLRMSTLGPEVPAATAGDAPYLGAGYQLFPSFHAQVALNWRRLQTEWARDAAILEQCERNPAQCPKAGSAYLSILRQASLVEREAQIELVNARVNASVRYQSDFARHSEWDVWSSPLKTLGQAGDCEDYAIAKFYLLKALGIPEVDMRIVLLRDRQAREDHAVLAVRGRFAWHLLDNRHDGLDSDASTPHYRPVIALNSFRQDLFAAPFVEVEDAEGKGGLVARTASTATRAAEPGQEYLLRGTR
jgi:predicted transglutaminase-like cysteine proteinase